MDILNGRELAEASDDALRDINKSKEKSTPLDNGKPPKNGTRPESSKLLKRQNGLNESKLLFNYNVDSNPALLEQYKLYIATTNQTITMQTQANQFFLTVHTFIVGFIVGVPQFVMHPTLPIWLLFVCLVGIFLTVTWFVTIRAYRVLNSARLQTIQAIETKLPANIYLREWQIAREERRQGTLRKVSVEQMAPYAYGVLYVVLTISLFLITP